MSVLGPPLWNILHDDVLNLEKTKHPKICRLVAFADDHLVVSTDTNEEAVLARVETAVKAIPRCASSSREVRGNRTYTANGYPGVDTSKNAAMKVERAGAALRKLMPRLKGPAIKIRRLLSEVVNSILLYAAPAWADGLKAASNRSAPTTQCPTLRYKS